MVYFCLRKAVDLTEMANLHLLRINKEQIMNLAKIFEENKHKVEEVKDEDWPRVINLIKEESDEIAEEIDQMTKYTEGFLLRKEEDIEAFCIYHKSYSWDGWKVNT